ncbi:MAG: hypothetical protein R3F61_37560 [Myxococcota bacterium]
MTASRRLEQALFSISGVALASSLCGEPAGGGVRALSFDEGRLIIDGAVVGPDVLAVVTGQVRLSNLSYTWDVATTLTHGDESIWVGLDLPPEAFVDDAARDYLMDLWVSIDFGSRRQRIGPLYVAWSDPSSYTILDSSDFPAWASNGVLRSELRLDVPPGVRVMPPRLSPSGPAVEVRTAERHGEPPIRVLGGDEDTGLVR